MQNKLPTIIGTALVTALVILGGLYINNPEFYKGSSIMDDEGQCICIIDDQEVSIPRTSGGSCPCPDKEEDGESKQPTEPTEPVVPLEPIGPYQDAASDLGECICVIEDMNTPVPRTIDGQCLCPDPEETTTVLDDSNTKLYNIWEEPDGSFSTRRVGEAIPKVWNWKLAAENVHEGNILDVHFQLLTEQANR